MVVVEPSNMAHKYDFRLVLESVNISDGELFTVEVDLMGGRSISKMISINIASKINNVSILK